MARKNLYINDVNIGSFGIYISSDTYLNSPQIDYSSYRIPAKMGSVLKYNDRFDNVTRKFTCYVPQGENVDTALDQLKSLLYFTPGYMKIYSDYDSTTYQMGYLAQDIQVKPLKSTATFDLYFSCKPHRFYKTNTQYTNTGETTSNDITILSRRYNIVKNILMNVPIEIVPNNSAFVVYFVTYYATTTYSSVTIAVTPGVGYDDPLFVSAFKYTYDQGYDYASYELSGYLGASDQGSLTLTNVAMDSEAFGVMMPAGFVGDIDINIDGTTYSQSFSPSGTMNNGSDNTKIGLEALYTFKTYPNPFGTYAQNPIIYVKGLSSADILGLGEITWDGCIELNNHHLINLYTQKRYCWFSIDSETLEAKLKYGTQALGYNTVNASDRISVDGKLGGMCRKVQIFMYGRNGSQTDTGYVEDFTVDPRWWKV